MNRTGIEWTEHTWNPVVGCKNNCSLNGVPWCYARKQARRFKWCPQCQSFEPHLHPERLEQPMKRKKPTTIFVGSMCDLWGDWVPPQWIEDTLTSMYWANPEDPEDPDDFTPSPHTFLALTKNPKRYNEFREMIPENLWCGVTITNNRQATQTFGFLPHESNQSFSESWIAATSWRFISLEPLLEDLADNVPLQWGIREEWLRAVIIGPLTNSSLGPVTKREWVDRIIEIADNAGVPVILKGACENIGYTEAEIAARQITPWR